MATLTDSLQQLSLFGLLKRLDLIEQHKQISRPNEEEQAVLATESQVKKAVAEALPEFCSAGLTSLERKEARVFLEAQLKSVEGGTKVAEARKGKLQELLNGVQEAPNRDDSPHVAGAKVHLNRAQKEFDQINKDYEKWEKGKKMLGVDELKEMKRTHEDQKKKLEAAKEFVQLQLEKRRECAAPLPAALQGGGSSGSGSSAAARARGSAGPGIVRGGGPAVRTTGMPSGGKGGSGKGGYPSGPAAMGSEAMRQAQLASQIRAEIWAAEAPPPEPVAAAPPRPRPQKQRAEEPQDQPVLSYACTVAAVAEICGISQEEARNMAATSLDFVEQLEEDAWGLVKERSLAIEKERAEKQKEAEKKKTANALARKEARDAKERGDVAPATPVQPLRPVPGRPPGPAAKAAPPGVAQTNGKAKSKAKPKAASPKKGSLDSLAHGNRFGGLDSDSSDGADDGAWTKVKR
mmetsp:Transcript_98220/g.194563  ORF Transcript_98220/g.194563 Transcript_98220/m.194563 type:complete len:463 (+) Transcript_98220:70-1458(+)